MPILLRIMCALHILCFVSENAKWFLNVQWQMEGVDIHLDVNVGKQLSALGHTLTMLTGSQEEDEPVTVDYDSDEVDQVDGNAASLVRSHKQNVRIYDLMLSLWILLTRSLWDEKIGRLSSEFSIPSSERHDAMSQENSGLILCLSQ